MTADSTREPESATEGPDPTAAAPFKCCACCATGTPGECGFNGRGNRDHHASPCHKCEPEAYAAFIGSQTEREDADVPF